MLQITHFYSVKFLAWESASVKFWTNIMSGVKMLQLFDQVVNIGNFVCFQDLYIAVEKNQL